MFGIDEKGKNPIVSDLLKEFKTVAKNRQRLSDGSDVAKASTLPTAATASVQNFYHAEPVFNDIDSFSESSDDVYEDPNELKPKNLKPVVPPKPVILKLFKPKSSSLSNADQLGQKALDSNGYIVPVSSNAPPPPPSPSTKPTLLKFHSLGHPFRTDKADDTASSHSYLSMAPLVGSEQNKRASYLSIHPDDEHIYEAIPGRVRVDEKLYSKFLLEKLCREVCYSTCPT